MCRAWSISSLHWSTDPSTSSGGQPPSLWPSSSGGAKEEIMVLRKNMDKENSEDKDEDDDKDQEDR